MTRKIETPEQIKERIKQSPMASPPPAPLPTPTRDTPMAPSRTCSPEEVAAAWTRWVATQNLTVVEENFFKQKPTLDGHTVVCQGFALQEEILKKYEERLLAFLRRELSNAALTLRFDRQKHIPQKRLTPDEQLDAMAGQYPLLEELRRRLDLDFGSE